MCPRHVSYGFAPSEAEDHGPSCHQLRLDCRWHKRKPAYTVAPFPVHTPVSISGDCRCFRLVPSHIWTSWPPHAPEHCPDPVSSSLWRCLGRQAHSDILVFLRPLLEPHPITLSPRQSPDKGGGISRPVLFKTSPAHTSARVGSVL